MQQTPYWRTLLLRTLFQLLPTLAVCYFLLLSANNYFSLLRQQHQVHALLLAIGMAAGILAFVGRLRLLPALGILLLLGWLIHRILANIVMGDVDSFFLAHQFLVYYTLIFIGVVISGGFARYSYWGWILAIALVAAGTAMVLKHTEYFVPSAATFPIWVQLLGPLLIYAVYIIFISHKLRRSFSLSYWRLGASTLAFVLLALGFAAGTFFLFGSRIDKTIEDIVHHQQGKPGEGLLQQNPDGTKSVSGQNTPSGSRPKDKQLLFAAYIDNFFPDGQTPNPLYLTSNYYAQFDTATETFHTVKDMPDRDLFMPNPGKTGLYITQTDSSVLAFGADAKLKKMVDVTIYNKSLASDQFVAPSTAYSMQPIAVDKNYRKEYRSAYKAKSRVSELNSAYFIYNVDKPIVRAFQEERFQTLRAVHDFSSMDSNVLQYYTFVPESENFDKVRDLAHSLADGHNLPIDKILAIRDYYLSKDELGKPLFKYSDNPGEPDIPSASKLNYFLFESHTGYCTYFAGTTLFMLRSLGIPSRIAVGFLTEPRGNSQGWYYVYADQAHAWVQAYLPGYGWLDFDTTIGNEDARQSDRPDGTPPIQPGEASLAAEGVVAAVDTIAKTMTISTRQIVQHGKALVGTAENLRVEVSLAQIAIDTNLIALNDVQVGDSATAISYDRKLLPQPFGTMHAAIAALAQPLPVDQVEIRRAAAPPKTTEIDPDAEGTGISWLWLLWLLPVGVIVLLVYPKLVHWSYGRKMRRSEERKADSGKAGYGMANAYYQHRWLHYYLYMMGQRQGSLSLIDFAKRIDATEGSPYAQFAQKYTDIKYGPASNAAIAAHLAKDTMAIWRKNRHWSKIFKWLNFMRAARYVLSTKNKVK